MKLKATAEQDQVRRLLKHKCNIPKKQKKMPTSRQRFENWMLSGLKNSSPTFNSFSAGTRHYLSTSLTLYWQYLHPAESFGLSRYPPAAFTKSLAHAAHVSPDGGLNTANSSGLHVIFRPLRNYCQPNQETCGCGRDVRKFS